MWESRGYYHIRSIYFDDYHNSSFYSNEAGVDPRVKYRIRIYNAGDASIKLEKNQRKRYDAEICGSAIPSAGGYADPGAAATDRSEGSGKLSTAPCTVFAPDAHKTDAAQGDRGI